MKKIIKLSSNDLKNIINESVKNVLNELDSKTYFNAADKAFNLKQYDRGIAFKNQGEMAANQEIESDSSDYYFEIFQRGFAVNNDDDVELYYFIKNDSLYAYPDDSEIFIEPGDYDMRLSNRELISKIIKYFNKYRPDSKYNDKNLWIK